MTTRRRPRVYANTTQRKTGHRRDSQHRVRAQASVTKFSDEAPDASELVLPKEFANCRFCGGPTKILARPGAPVYHTVCAAEAGIDHGPEWGGKR